MGRNLLSNVAILRLEKKRKRRIWKFIEGMHVARGRERKIVDAKVKCVVIFLSFSNLEKLLLGPSVETPALGWNQPVYQEITVKNRPFPEKVRRDPGIQAHRGAPCNSIIISIKRIVLIDLIFWCTVARWCNGA